MAEATPSDSAALARHTEPDAPGPIDESAEAALEPEEAEQTSDLQKVPAIEPPPITPAKRTDDRGEAVEPPGKARRGRPPGSKNKLRQSEAGTGQRIGSQTFPASLPQPPRENPLDDAEPSETCIGILVPHGPDDEMKEGCLLAGSRRELNVRDEKWLPPVELRKNGEGLIKEYDMLSNDRGAVNALSVQESR